MDMDPLPFVPKFERSHSYVWKAGALSLSDKRILIMGREGSIRDLTDYFEVYELPDINALEGRYLGRAHIIHAPLASNGVELLSDLGLADNLALDARAFRGPNLDFTLKQLTLQWQMLINA